MSERRLFCEPLAEGECQLPQHEAHHAVNVLRCACGDEFTLFDGAGREAAGTISRVERQKVMVQAGAVREKPFELAIRVTLAVAMPKPSRQPYLIEKCTELGVAGIWPMLTERSMGRAGEATLEKWRRRAIEACKQANRAWVPRFASPCGYAECLARADTFDAATLCCPRTGARPFPEFLGALRGHGSVLVLIGPEGGWTDAECEAAANLGIPATLLAPAVLRTETAAIAVCALTACLCTTE